MNIETELRGRIKALEYQRERALSDHAVTEGSLAFANGEKALLARENAELKARVAVLEGHLQTVTQKPGGD